MSRQHSLKLIESIVEYLERGPAEDEDGHVPPHLIRVQRHVLGRICEAAIETWTPAKFCGLRNFEGKRSLRVRIFMGSGMRRGAMERRAGYTF